MHSRQGRSCLETVTALVLESPTLEIQFPSTQLTGLTATRPKIAFVVVVDMFPIMHHKQRVP